MTLRRVVRIAAFLMSGSALLWGQQQVPAPQHIGAEAPPLAMQLDPEYKNVLIGGVFLGGTWDNRGLARGTTPLRYTSDVRLFAQPSLAFQQTLSTVNWTIAYTPGVSVSQHKNDSYQYTHNVAGDLMWTPNARFNLHLRQDYSVSNNPFERVGRVPILPELNGYFGPNDGAVVPNQQRTTLVSNAEMSYRLSRHTAIGATGGYQRQEYDNLPTLYGYAGSMMPSHSYNGSLYYSQQISKGQTIGIQYAVSDFYTEPYARVQAHAAMLFDTWRITPRTTLTLYGGEEYSRSHTIRLLSTGAGTVGVAAEKISTNPTGGLTLNWMGDRSAVQITGVRRISDGGGLMSAVTMTNGAFGFRRRLSQRWSSDIRLSIADQRALDLFSNQGRFRTLWGGVALTRDITNNFSVRAEYARVRQTGSAAVNVLRPGDHNLVQFALNWHFRKPLSR